MLLDMESSKLLRSLARVLRPCAVKKLMALSRAELTLLPVANLFWVCVIRSEVCCNCSRFARTPAERVYVRHLVYPFPFRLFDVPFLKRIFLSPSIFPEYWSQLITLARKLPVKKDN